MSPEKTNNIPKSDQITQVNFLMNILILLSYRRSQKNSYEICYENHCTNFPSDISEFEENMKTYCAFDEQDYPCNIEINGDSSFAFSFAGLDKETIRNSIFIFSGNIRHTFILQDICEVSFFSFENLNIKFTQNFTSISERIEFLNCTLDPQTPSVSLEGFTEISVDLPSFISFERVFAYQSNLSFTGMIDSITFSHDCYLFTYSINDEKQTFKRDITTIIILSITTQIPDGSTFSLNTDSNTTIVLHSYAINVLNNINIEAHISNTFDPTSISFTENVNDINVTSNDQLPLIFIPSGPQFTLRLNGFSSIGSIIYPENADSDQYIILSSSSILYSSLEISNSMKLTTIYNNSGNNQSADIVSESVEIFQNSKFEVVESSLMTNLLILHENVSFVCSNVQIFKNPDMQSSISYLFGDSEDILTSHISSNSLTFENRSISFSYDTYWEGETIPDLQSFFNRPIEFARAKEISCSNLTEEFSSPNFFFSSITHNDLPNSELVMESKCQACNDDNSKTCIYGVLVKQPQYVYNNVKYKLNSGDLCLIILPYILTVLTVVGLIMLKKYIISKKKEA